MSQPQAAYGSPAVVAFSVEGTPRPKQSFKFKKGDGTYRPFTPKLVKAWQNEVAWAAKQEMIGEDPLLGELAVSMTFHLPDRRRRDLDNLSKGVLDAMNGIVFDDDQQVVDLHVYKRLSKKYPGVSVKVEKL